MKKGLFATISCSTLIGCMQTPHNIGIANPASEYCIQQGGYLEIKKDQVGNEYGICHLPDGRASEEWEFFRAQNKGKQ